MKVREEETISAFLVQRYETVRLISATTDGKTWAEPDDQANHHRLSLRYTESSNATAVQSFKIKTICAAFSVASMHRPNSCLAPVLEGWTPAYTRGSCQLILQRP